MKEDRLLQIFNRILVKKGIAPLEELDPKDSLRDDLGFDSMDLAELTVRVEDEFGIDIFENGIVRRVKEVLTQVGSVQD